MKKISVLYIDDEYVPEAEVLGELKLRGFSLRAASSGKQGLAHLARKNSDVILCDLNMPEMNGLETLGKIREFNATVPVIIMTSRGSVQTAVQAIKQGAYDFVLKPLEINEIETTIRKALDSARLKQKLNQSESHLRLLLGTVPDLVYSLNPKGEFISLGPAIKNLLGFEPEELIGTNVFALIHPEDRKAVRTSFEHSMKTGDSEVKKFEFRLIDKEKRTRFVEVNRRLIFENGKVIRQDGIGRDITERKALEQRLQLHSEQLEVKIHERTEKLEYATRQLTALNVASNRFTQILDEETLLDEIPTLLTHTLDFDRASFLLEKNGELQLRSFSLEKDSPEVIEQFLDRVGNKEFKLPPHFLESFKENRTIFIPDLNADPRWPREDGKPIKTKAIVVSPVRSNKKPVGIIIGNMQHHDREMDLQDVERFEMFTNMVGLALDNVRAYRSLEKKVIERTKSLKKVNSELRTKTRQLEKNTYSLGKANIDLLKAQEELKAKNHEMEMLFGAVTESNVRLQAILDASHSAIVMVDKEGRITSSNKRIHDFFCLEMSDIINESFDVFLKFIQGCFKEPKKFLSFTRKLKRTASETYEPEELEALLSQSFEVDTAQARFVSIFSMPVHDQSKQELGRVWVYTDITKIKRADEQLRTIVEASPIPFIVSRKRDGEILFANERMAEIVGTSRQELIGQFTPEYYYNLDDREEVLQKLKQDGSLRNHEVQIKRADGQPVWMIFSAVETEIAGEAVLIGAFYDINKRKQAEEALRQSEEKFRELTENIKEAFWMVDLEKHKTIYVSPTYKDIFGRSPDTLFENPDEWLQAIHPDDRQHLVSNMEASNHEENEQEFRIVWPDNSIRWIRSRAFPIRNTQGEVYRYCGVSEDITERVEAREALQRERNFVSTILETAGALVIVLDTKGRIVRFNRACELTTGYRFKDVEGSFFWDLFLIPGEVVKVRATFDELLRGEFPNYRENYWITKSGEQRLIAWTNTALLDADGQVDFVIGTGIDITERKQAEEGLKLYKEIFMNSNDSINILDPQGHFLEQNPAHRSFNGYSDQELKGKTPAIFTDQETFERIGGILDDTGSFRGEILSRPKKGKPVDVELSAFTMYDDAGEVTHRIGFARDITERKRAEKALQKSLRDLEKANQELHETHTQLVQSEKMASLGMLVAGIAHEINTPIGAIYSMHDTLKRAVVKLKEALESKYTDIFQTDTTLTNPIRIIQEANKVIDNGCERVTTIVRRLRSFARLDEAELKTVDIHEGIEDTLTLVHHEIKHNITIEKHFGKVPPISCFPGRLNQVFLNLLINGKQAIKDKGVIKITTAQKQNKIYITFSDNGVGIQKEKLSKIFDPGFTTKGVGVGTGLGLSICYQIMQEHRGEIKVESTVGEGSTFTLILPTNLDELLEVGT